MWNAGLDDPEAGIKIPGRCKRWPVQVQCIKQGTQSQCSGTTQSDGVGREVGGGFRVRGHIYICGWLMLMYHKNDHNIVK